MSLPSLFVSHGPPTTAVEPTPVHHALAALGETLRDARAVVVASAHWETETPTAGAVAAPGMIYDFRGFPPELYELVYPAPGEPALARRVVELLGAAGIAAALDEARGLDHGVWVPLLLMHPAADLPVVPLSIQPGRGPAEHLAVGRALAPLAAEGVLVVGSGNMTHDLRGIDYAGRHAPPAYVSAFTEWMREALAAGDETALLAYRRAPFAERNHPTAEHILPLFVAYGAAGPAPSATRVHAGYDYGVLAMDAWRFDPA